MKVNLMSQRAQAIMANPTYYLLDQSAKFTLTLSSDDKVLTTHHSEKVGSIEFIFAEVLAKFAQNKKLSELWKINFREAENFLRDENHLPAFDQELSLIAEIFTKTKISIIASMVKCLHRNNFENLKNEVFHWEKLSLVEKNKWSIEFLRPLGWELILSEGDLIYIKIQPELSAEELKIVIDQLLKNLFLPPNFSENQEHDLLLPLKLVAV